MKLFALLNLNFLLLARTETSSIHIMHVTHNAGADILIDPSPGDARRSSSSNRKAP
jgi:hypothetical protein